MTGLRTGRPKNLRIRLALLERLPNESEGEIIRSGSFSRRQLKHYLREMEREGLIQFLPYFSHLDTDGEGAARYGLTRKGRRVRQQLRGPESHRPPQTETTDEKVTGRPAGAVRRPGGRTERRHAAQRFVGVHNLCFTMVIEAGFRRPFHWEKQHMMANGSWVSRHARFTRDLDIQESGGSRWDQPGAAGHTISLKFKVNGDDPHEVEAKALQTAFLVRRTLEQEYGCQLSEPVQRVSPKFSVVGDPVAKAIRDAGGAVHGEVGVDDTPEDGTLEFNSADAVRRYFKGVETLATLGEKMDRLIEDTKQTREQNAQLVRAMGAVVDGQAALSKLLGDFIAKLTPQAPKPVQGPAPAQDLIGFG